MDLSNFHLRQCRDARKRIELNDKVIPRLVPDSLEREAIGDGMHHQKVANTNTHDMGEHRRAWDQGKGGTVEALLSHSPLNP